MKNKLNLIGAGLSGLLLTAAFPTIGIDWLAWFALIPLLAALRQAPPKHAMRLGFIAGLVHFFSLLYWLIPTMRIYGYLPLYVCIPVLILFAGVLALFMTVFTTALSRLASKPVWCALLIPVLWVTVEYMRTFIFSGFPWELLGYSLYSRLNLIQIADIAGVYGVSFLVAFANAAGFILVMSITNGKWQDSPVSKKLAGGMIVAFAIGLGLTWFYGTLRIDTIDKEAASAPKATITVVQGNIDQKSKWDAAFVFETVKKYNALSLSARSHNPDLIIWPESAAPFYFLYEVPPTKMVMKGVKNTGTHFLIGSPAFGKQGELVEYFNRAYLIGPGGGVLAKYDKAHLVPFGEYTPYKQYLPFLGKMVEHVGDFSPGKRGETIFLKDIGLGVQICYEIIFPGLSRAAVKNKAQLLLNITNDAWYGKTGGPFQHFSMVVFRAVENRRPLARAANTGISGFIDPVGRILDATPLFVETTVTRELPLLNKMAIYTRFGDVFSIGCLLISILAAIFAVFNKTK